MQMPQIIASAITSLIFAPFFSSSVSAQGADFELRFAVSAGEFHRRGTIVSFELPQIPSGPVQLRDSQGNIVPVQIERSGGRATFILGELAAGATEEFLLTGHSSAGAQTGGVSVIRKGSKLQISAGQKQILEYQAEPGTLPRPDIDPIYTRGGYIHPVLTPSGKLVTDDFPPNHIHQHGIWFAWTRTEFQGRQPDFWNMGQGKGLVEFAGLDQLWNGPVHGGFEARHRFVDRTSGSPRVVLNEKWAARIYNADESRRHFVFDLVSTQTCAGGDPLILPEYYYGGLGVRGNWLWNGPGKASFLTSEGVRDRIAGNETRGRWCYMGGEVDGQLAGIAILGHPENFRAPQPMRLHPNEPFFCFAPSQLGSWKISPGDSYVSRYRFVVFDGPPDSAELDRLWNDYAIPPAVQFKHSNAP
jgi:hypothetical protein